MNADNRVRQATAEEEQQLLDRLSGAKRRRPKPPIVLAARADVAFLLDDLVSIDQAALLYGTTREAIEKKIERGHWLEKRQYHRDPQRGIWISRKGVQQWVTTGNQS